MCYVSIIPSFKCNSWNAEIFLPWAISLAKGQIHWDILETCHKDFFLPEKDGGNRRDSDENKIPWFLLMRKTFGNRRKESSL